MSELNTKLAQIQAEFKSKKSRFNAFGKYYFRSAEDILEALKPFSKSLSVTFLVDEEPAELAGIPVIKSTASVSDGKEKITATAVVGIDIDQKGMQMPQRFGSASSYGKKYSLGNLLLIDDTQDADASNNHGAGAKTITKVESSKPKPAAWLNKGTPELDQAIKDIKAGEKTVEDLRQEYMMSNAIYEQLKGI